MIEELYAELGYEPKPLRPLTSVPSRIVIGGMGGSGYAGEALAFLLPERDIHVHRDYGLPSHIEGDALYIALSYSGTTEEALSFANEALKAGKRLAIVSSGGTLAECAAREQLPFVSVPTGVQPRYELISMVQALCALIGEHDLHARIRETLITKEHIEHEAEALATFLPDSIPLFYSSTANAVLARLAKIMMNETARMPAFTNSFPELNHNEMQALDTDMPAAVAPLLRFVLLRDPNDHPRITRRMDVFTSLMEERGRPVHAIRMTGERVKDFIELWMVFILASTALAHGRGIDTSTVPLIEAFKKAL
jgi:glucose/mannose-6-phosphate isomerase